MSVVTSVMSHYPPLLLKSIQCLEILLWGYFLYIDESSVGKLALCVTSQPHRGCSSLGRVSSTLGINAFFPHTQEEKKYNLDGIYEKQRINVSCPSECCAQLKVSKGLTCVLKSFLSSRHLFVPCLLLGIAPTIMSSEKSLHLIPTAMAAVKSDLCSGWRTDKLFQDIKY